MKMLIRNASYFLVLLALINCENSKDKSSLATNELTSEKTMYESALEVPVGKLGVLIYVDSLGVYDKERTNSPKDSLESELLKIEKELSLEYLIEQSAERILTKNKYDYSIIQSNPEIHKFLKALSFREYESLKDLKGLKLDNKFDDILLVQVSSGLTYDQQEQNKLAGKTSIYIDIIDAKTNRVKYSELISGNKYLNRKDFKTSHDFILNTMKESVVETVNILDKKY